jgi:hypothetical protein
LSFNFNQVLGERYSLAQMQQAITYISKVILQIAAGLSRRSNRSKHAQHSRACTHASVPEDEDAKDGDMQQQFA